MSKNPPPRDVPKGNGAHPPRRFLANNQPTLIERVVSWVMLVGVVLAFAVFYYAVMGGDITRCDETMEQCEALVGPYQVR